MKQVIRFAIIIALIAGGWYGYRHYRVRTAQPPMVEVSTGEEIICIKCGKVIDRSSIRTIRVPMTEARRYTIKKVDAICETCLQKGK